MAEYLRYVLKNIEPVRIADDSTSQSGQTNTLRYIPGTTIRGLVINALAKENNFEEWKEKLFAKDTAYLNAYPMAGEKELLPSPKGFYEDKLAVEGKKEIQNVVLNGDFTEGYKRAGLGRYCYFEEDCICYYNVETGSDMKIKINTELGEKRNVFRNEYIMPGQVFCGYIKIGFPELKEKLTSIFKNYVILGNARSAGLGKCRVLDCEVVTSLPYADYMPIAEEKNICYMMLLSNTAMRKENGELCGIDTAQLQKKLDVQNLKIEFCSTSTVTVRGYNRTWQTKIPSVMMFEQGSVFKLTYTGILTRERMEAVCNEGIGIRLNEGCGRVLFLKEYEKLCYKLAGKDKTDKAVAAEAHAEDAEVLKQIAKRLYITRLERAMEHYIVEEQLFQRGNISRSQLNRLDALVTAYRYSPKNAAKAIEKYLGHSMEKEAAQRVQKERGSFTKIDKFTKELFEKPLEETLSAYLPESKPEIMGIAKPDLLSKDEELARKLQLITELVRYDNKKESR